MVSIATHLNKAPNQIVDVPAGTYTGAQGVFNGSAPSSGTYNGWLILRAPSKGAVVVQSLTTANQLNIQSGSKKILFIGFQFQGVTNCDGTDIRFWYCELWIPNVNRSDLNSYGPFNQPTPLIARSSNRVELYGCDIHEASDSSVLGGAQNFLYRGVHVYNAVPRPPDDSWHPDAPEINVNNPISRTTSVTLDYCDIDTTFGGGRAGGGVEVEAHDAGNIDVTVKDCWIHGSTDTGINLQAGSSKTVNLALQGTVRIWNYNNPNAIVSNGSGVNPARTLTVPDRRNNADPDLVIDPSGTKDSSVGLQVWLDAQPQGTSESDRTYIVFPAGATYRIEGGLAANRTWTTWTTDTANPALLFADDTAPIWVRPGPGNTTGDVSKPRYFITGNLADTGWDGTVSGNTVTRTDGVFTQAQRNQLMSVWWFDDRSPPEGAGVWNSTDTGTSDGATQIFTITAVSGDGKTATLNGFPHNSQGTRGQYRFWAVNPRGTWERYLRRTGHVIGTWTGRDQAHNLDAVSQAMRRAGAGDVITHPDQMVYVAANRVKLENLEIRGPNTGWDQYNPALGGYWPLETELFPGIVVPVVSNCELENLEVHEIWGSAMSVDGIRQSVHDCKIYRMGRQGIDMGKAYQCAIVRNVIHSNRHSHIDLEPNGNGVLTGASWPIQEIVIRDNIFGEGAGGSGQDTIASSSGFAVSRIKFEGNRSTNADVTAGTIPDLSSMDTSFFGPPSRLTPVSGRFIWRNNRTDAARRAFTFRSVDLVLYENNDRQSATGGEGAGEFFGCTNFKSRSNTINGVLDPNQYEGGAGTTYFEIGQSGSGDSWWDAGAPDPPVPGL